MCRPEREFTSFSLLEVMGVSEPWVSHDMLLSSLLFFSPGVPIAAQLSILAGASDSQLPSSFLSSRC